MLRVGDSDAQTASVLAFPGKARMLQLREEDYNQETTEDRRPQNSSCLVQAWVSTWSKRARPEDKDPNSQATSMSLALPLTHSPTSTQCHSVQLPLCQVPAHIIHCLSQNPTPETKSDKQSYILGPSHPGDLPPHSFRSQEVNTHRRWGLHASVDDVVSENVPGAQATHTTFPFEVP